MDWLSLMQGVAQAIYANKATPHQPGHDPDNLVGNINQMFNQYGEPVERRGQAPSPDMLGQLLGQIQQTIYNSPSTPHKPGTDPGNLLDTIGGLFNQYSQQQGLGKVLPASRDPYGDAADEETWRGRVRPASEDVYGDPGDVGTRGGRIRPASEDPYGDPADYEV